MTLLHMFFLYVVVGPLTAARTALGLGPTKDSMRQSTDKKFVDWGAEMSQEVGDIGASGARAFARSVDGVGAGAA